MHPKLYTSIGLMSGTSIDGLDAALVETDGRDHVRILGFVSNPFDPVFRTRLRGLFGQPDKSRRAERQIVERELTELHAILVRDLLRYTNRTAAEIDVVGFHGQTLWHQPAQHVTLQIGDGALLADLTGIPIVNDFRTADVRAGGHGAPLVPLYHRALAAALPKPVAILNIGGVSNISWIGGLNDEDVIACDVGPGNAMIDDWMLRHTGRVYDEHGLLAASGTVDAAHVEAFMTHAFFAQKPPKSLDRNAFKKLVPSTSNAADGAATLTMMTARAVAHSLTLMPAKPTHLYITGGGRLNRTLMQWIGDLSAIPVHSVDDLGWSGDGLEAEAFAYLAVRSLLGLPLSMPATTGVPRPMTGGTLHQPKLAS